MTDNAPTLSANKQALLKIRELKQQLAAAQEYTDEPIAIVSMACRFPQTSDTPEKFWQTLVDQTDLVGEVPSDRWDLDAFFSDDPEYPGKMYARKGVFLDQIDQMDPEFFGISPREATWVDPQQRLLMEVGWEAIERAGWIPDEIGEHTGVFVGWMHNDYQNEASDSFLNLNPYIATGAAGSFLCGRLAYYLGLQGPSVAVDTACSSSLVALHLAIQSLQRRDCDRALVGGVNAICSPTTNILTCKLKALSPQGHSRAFDAAADGYLRGEGCGVLTLRRLSDAENEGDDILGIIRGSAIGHNGFSSGLTAPNPKAQEKVIRQALERARVAPDQIGYLEAHGTGTELGDPIEVTAASAAYCETRTDANPLLIGSVKTNIGHLEAAAGMAGIIKVLMAMQKDCIPGQLNFETPNPHIPWNDLPLKVVTEPTAWPNPEQRIAGVSAFGMSGTNAHVVIEAPANQSASIAEKCDTDSKPTLITLSAKTDEAIHQMASQYSQSLRGFAGTLQEFASATNLSRSHFEHRAAVIASDRTTAIDQLQALARGSKTESSFVAHRRRPPRIAWQFTGQGAQYVGMGLQLYETQPVFRSVIDQCDNQLRSVRNESLRDVMFDDSSDNPLIHQTHWTQPATFALQMGLVKLLESWDLKPNMVLGHSVGQYAAACTAGILRWEAGLSLIAERGRLIGSLPSGGLMLAVFAPTAAVKQAIASEPNVSLAAINGTHVVISGDQEAVQRLGTAFQARGVRTRELATSHAFHSHLMDPILDSFAQFANQTKFQTAKLPLICNISGKALLADQLLDGKYWADHIRQPVSYAPSVESLAELKCEVLVELGPQSVLTRMAAANWKPSPETLISCLQKEGGDQHAVVSAVGQMYALGVTPNFREWNQRERGARVALPTYPFQRRRFWGPDKPRAAHAEYHTAHPLLGGKLALAGTSGESRYEGFIDDDSPAWITDHEVMGATVLPGAALIDMAIEASGNHAINHLVFEQPIRPVGRTSLQTVVKKIDDQEDNHQRLETFALLAGQSNWQRHFTCDIASDVPQKVEPIDRTQIESRLSESESPDVFYDRMRSLGLNYGPSFQCIREIRFSDQEVLARLESPSDIRGYHVAPNLLDAALHSLAIGILKDENTDSLFLPVGANRVEFFAPVANETNCVAKWKQDEGTTRTADVVLFSDDGQVLVRIIDLKVQRVSLSALRRMSGAGAERLVYELDWKPTRLNTNSLEPKNWLVITHVEDSDDGNSRHSQFTTNVCQSLTNSGHRVTRVALAPTESFEQVSETDFQLDGRQKEHWGQLLDQHSVEDNKPAIDGIVWALTDTPQGDERILDPRVESLMTFVQSMLDRNWRKLPCGLQLVTRDAQMTENQITQVDPTQTQFWGLGRVIAAEQPELRCRLLDVPGSELQDANTSSLVAEIALTETEDAQHLIRDGQIYVPRMTSSKLRTRTSFAANPDGSYLITGGLGKLGRHAAKWLAEKGAKQVVLVSRRAPDESANQGINDLLQADCEVVIHQADMSSRSQVESLFARFSEDLNPLSGVIHAAGVLDDGLIESQTPARFENVLAPKIRAATLLDELTHQLQLDLFVLYSSAASVLGSPGQSNYATGNAFLDGLAFQRRQKGLPALAINWGPWTEGMADDERILKRLALQGITPLSADEAHATLDMMLVNGTTQATVMDVDWKRMRIGPTGEVPAILQDLVGSRKKTRSAESALVAKLKKLPSNAQRDLLLKTVQDSLQGILSTDDAPETDRPLIEMGLDSLMAVEFGTELQQMLGDQFNVGPTMLFDHPTIDAITDHVLELIVAQTTGATDVDNEVVPHSSTQQGSTTRQAIRDDVAIIGLSCRFPGAKDVTEFWQNLLNGVDSVCDIPNDRWDIDRFYSADRESGKMYTRRGGFLDDIGDFDPGFFNISEKEACWIDPQHRMLLENCHRAMEDAGIPTAPLPDNNVGVFMGIMGSDYAFLPSLDDEQIIKGFEGAGLSHSAGVGRISYLFGFEGPSVAIDTASSSSLVAVFQAMRSLQDGNCNLALAGGVNAILAPVNSLLMSKAGLLSPDGRCKSFSKSADGFGRGEGCGVVILKRLQDAKRDGDRIMAVIKGGAVVHNGFSGGITSPSGKAQSRVIDAALKDAGVIPSEVQYLEAHGTGTEYGDPMELTAAAKVYGKGRSRDNPLLVGSVKANISHLEAAGGSSGLIKTVLSLHHGVIPQQIHCETPSPHIPWRRLPVQMISETTQWPECERRLAGITALGLVGTNAHLILSDAESIVPEEPPEKEPLEKGSPGPEERLLVVSAKSNQSLKSLCQQYSDHLHAPPEINLDDLCYTLNTGRRHHERRVAIPFTTREKLATQLKAMAADGHVESSNQRKSTTKLMWFFPDFDLDVRKRLAELISLDGQVAEFVAACDQRLQSHSSAEENVISILDLVADSTTESQHPDLFRYILQSGLAKRWEALGISPDATAGNGVGQYVAACTAGCLCFLDALILVYERERRLQNDTPADSKDWNSFEQLADQFNYYPPNLPLICSLTGDVVPVHRSLGGAYWREHATAQPNVDAMRASMASLECNAQLEFRDCESEPIAGSPDTAIITSLCPSQSAVGSINAAVGQLYELGFNPDFSAMFRGKRRQKLSLPTYPFQKKRYWITEISKFMDLENQEETSEVKSILA